MRKLVISAHETPQCSSPSFTGSQQRICSELLFHNRHLAVLLEQQWWTLISTQPCGIDPEFRCTTVTAYKCQCHCNRDYVW